MKIIITDKIRNRIKFERKKNNINSVDLSKKIKNSNTYISLIENKRIAKIEIEDLKNIFNIILKLQDKELDDYISELTSDSPDSQNPEGTIVYYDENNKSFTEDGFKKITNTILTAFNKTFEDNPEYAFKSLGELMNNLHFDLGFMLGLFRIPFYLLGETDFEIRKKLFNEIGDVVKKYIEEYGTQEDSNEG